MSRPLRIEYPGAWYHVMNRGRARQVIFPDDDAYRAFLRTLEDAVRRFRVEVHAFCLMPNHYHLLVRTPMGNLARFMRQVDGLYTQRHNRLMDTDGPLFRGRYKALLVDADAYLLSVSRYIHRNPIDGERPLVARLSDWRWSSYPDYAKGDGPDWLTRETTYQMLGHDARHERFQAFVEAGVEEEIETFYGRQRQPPVLGDETFRQRALGAARSNAEVPRHQRHRWHDPAAVVRAVADEYGVAPTALTQRGRKSRALGEARRRAIWLCRRETEATLAQLGELFGGVHYSAINQNVRRLQAAVDADRLEQWRESVISRLDPQRL